jgi:UDP-N-acetylmuramyl pentapeptide synthase
MLEKFSNVKQLILRRRFGALHKAARSVRYLVSHVGNHQRIGIAGSAGKTTTARLLAAVVETQGATLYQNQPVNGPPAVAKTLLKLRPRHRFCVQELAIPGPGAMGTHVKTFRPHIGVVTLIKWDHYGEFRGLYNTAAEKGKLIEGLPAGGVAVLNADDHRVLAMRDRTAADVITFGLASNADVRGRVLERNWPDRFTIEIACGSQSALFKTRLVGKHWAVPVLAAAAIEHVEPMETRMSPVETTDGPTFIRDDEKAPFWTVGPSLEVLRHAQARRKIAVIGTISDYSGDSTRRYKKAARLALEVAEQVYFVGRQAHILTKWNRSHGDGRVMLFEKVFELDRHLHEKLEPGDLVLLKGSGTSDHLGRLALSWSGGIECWLPSCRRQHHCDVCPERLTPHIPAT